MTGRFLLFFLLSVATAAAEAGSDAIVLYPGYGDPRGAAVEGRVIESEATTPPRASDSKWRNLLRNIRLFFNDEREGRRVVVRVAGKDWSAVSDEEGYFRIAIDATQPLAPGWQAATAEVRGRVGEGGILIVPPGNVFGIISDVDDTILVSDVTDKDKLLANTLLRNPLQRQAVPGVAVFYRRLAERNPHPDAAPTFYLSASPRQFYTSIQAFLDFNDFPRGVLITKKITNDRTSEPLLNQIAYKTEKIEEILARLPDVRFVLIGDDGEKDPEIYHDISTRFPARVEAVWIRRVNPDPARAVFPEQRNLAQALGADAGK